MTRAITAAVVWLSISLSAQQVVELAPVKGLTAGPALASAYDAILDADFDEVPDRLGPACGDVPAFCTVMEAVSAWWRIALDPGDRRHDARFRALVERAIDEADGWTRKEPARAEAWFAQGAAYSARAQWRILRGERLAAARDGKRIKQALERALALDPAMHDAKFGLGLYRYYAGVSPALFRVFRFFLLLPGGDREEGLCQMIDAQSHGSIMRGEAEYQLHLIYLWYEHRDKEALELIRGLEARYPHNPLFYLAEADILDKYFHDTHASAAVLERLAALAADARVNEAAIAARRASARLAALPSH